jgi:hypothetical protein
MVAAAPNKSKKLYNKISKTVWETLSQMDKSGVLMFKTDLQCLILTAFNTNVRLEYMTIVYDAYNVQKPDNWIGKINFFPICLFFLTFPDSRFSLDILHGNKLQMHKCLSQYI